jgi:hypothetical protein
MYLTAEATQPTDTAFPLGLTKIVHRTFPDGATRVDDDAVVRHLSDLCAGYDVPYRRDIASRVVGNTFTAMARSIVSSMPTDPIDLVVVAHDTPDLDHRLAATTYLSEALPASSLQFTVSEGGSCTPYTALRLAGGYASRHGYQRVLVLLMDQATLPYDTGVSLSGDAAVGLLLSRPCPTDLALRQVSGVSDLPTVLADVLPSSAAVIAGPGINPRDLPPDTEVVWQALSGAPCTATWAGLAHVGRPVVLVDYEPRTGELGVCAVGGS